jgi:acetolactate synthase-1/2/3 large subunit
MQVPQGLANPEKEVLCYYGDRAFSMTAIDMETANRFKVPYIAVVGNNSAMNQIRYGQLAKYGQESGNVGDLLSDLPFGKLAEMLGGYGEEVHDPTLIPGALRCARESVEKPGHVCRRQHLGRSGCVRARHDAQTITSNH